MAVLPPLLRAVLRLTNLLLALCGLAVMGYSVYMYGEIHRQAPPPHRSALPWFIVATASAGLFAFVTAATGLIGSARNSKAWLGLYSLLAVVLLLAALSPEQSEDAAWYRVHLPPGQALLVLAFFADAAWQRRLPHDETGEAARIQRWVRKRMAVCQWVALGVLLLQVVSLAVAFALNAAQQRQLAVDSDEDEEVFGRRRPLLQPGQVNAATAAGSPGQQPGPSDARALRMRDKYEIGV